MIKITLSDLNDFITQTTIDLVVYKFHFSWNDRGQYWTLEIMDQQKNLLLGKVKCVPNYDILPQFQNEFIPEGSIIFLHYNPKATTISRDDFKNGLAEFLYLTKAEVTELGAV
jgi:hypothetical protein